MLLQKRCSKEHLLKTVIPNHLLLDSGELTSTPMTLHLRFIPTGFLSIAWSILGVRKFKVIPGTDELLCGTKLPVGSVLYINTKDSKLKNMTPARMRNFETGLDGRFASADSVEEYVDKYMSINKVVKMPNGEWCACKILLCAVQMSARFNTYMWSNFFLRVCLCKSFVENSHCPDTCVAKSEDGVIKVDELIHGVKANGLAGRPMKSVAALKRQPEAASYDSLLDSKPVAIVSQDFSRSKKRGTKRPTGKQYIGRRVAKYFSAGLAVGTVMSSKLVKSKETDLTYRVMFKLDGGYTEDITALELGQAMAMYKLAKQALKLDEIDVADDNSSDSEDG